ncbi:hypothetical protein PM082_023465 [Marasmius tenuissimus]|nr:hypothetical protein PM082_023465 [Marasmius tenuissimus]
MISKLDTSLGALLAGTWLNSYCFMLELIMCYRYYTRCRSDPVWLKTVVGVTLAVDTIATLNHYACVYLVRTQVITSRSVRDGVDALVDQYTITHWGDEEYLTRQYWPIPVYLFTTGFSAWVVQHFLIFRFWILSKNRFITPLLVAGSMFAFGGAIATAIIIIQNPTYQDRTKLIVSASIWLISSAASDISIAVILVFTLQRMKTNMRRTKNLIRRLTTLAIQTGAPGSIIATIGLIVYFFDKESNVSVGLVFSLGRIYALTLLHNLVSRAHVRKAGTQTVLSRGTTMPDTALNFAGIGDTFLRGFETDPVDTTVSGIHVHQMVPTDISKHRTSTLTANDQEPNDVKSKSSIDHDADPDRDTQVPSAV